MRGLTGAPDPAFLARYGPRALILGGSEGIGAAFAQLLAATGFDLTLVARTASRLQTTADTIRTRHGVDVACRTMDLSLPTAAHDAAALAREAEFGLVIHNAGATHGVSLFLDQPVDHALRLVALNCTTAIGVAHAALGPMCGRGRGGLILVSSMSGLVGGGYVATYAAAKAFEITLAEGLHWEMARNGVDVLCAVLTLTDTPAMTRSGIILDAESEFSPMSADEAARGALAALGERPAWFAPGDAAAEALRTAPRLAASDAMSRSSARLWGVEVD